MDLSAKTGFSFIKHWPPGEEYDGDSVAIDGGIVLSTEEITIADDNANDTDDAVVPANAVDEGNDDERDG